MKHALLTLHAQTAIHAGTGATDSVIDLPIQREAHTGYPCIFGSSVKGSLRAKAEAKVIEKGKKNEDSDAQKAVNNILFGAKGSHDNTGGNAGSLLISDARLLLLPVRSLTGAFRWVTCPAVLSRFEQDAKRFKASISYSVPAVEEGQVICNDDSEYLYLEEYRLKVSKDNNLASIVEALHAALNYDNSQDMLAKQIAVISDGDFAYLAKYNLPVDAHIAVDSETKIVRNGALWYEETLPSDSILYIGVAAAESRQFSDKDGERRASNKEDSEVLADFQALFDSENPWLQIGGNETVGMGWCYVQCHIGHEG